MKFSYEIIKDETDQILCIKRSDGWSIPVNESNGDYQTYLRWLENPDAEENGTLQ